MCAQREFQRFSPSEIYPERKSVSRNNNTSRANKKRDLPTWRVVRDPKDQSRVRYELGLFSKSRPNHLSVPTVCFSSADRRSGSKCARKTDRQTPSVGHKLKLFAVLSSILRPPIMVFTLRSTARTR